VAVARVKWELTPDAQDYPAASAYLSLLVADAALRDELVAQLREAPILHYKAKDLLRASQLPLLPENNPHVAEDLQKIRKRRALSPILLVRGDLVRGFPLQVADGYHRVCASYWVMENTDIPCRLIDLPVVVRAADAAASVAVPALDKAVPAPEKPAPVKAASVKTAPVKAAPVKAATRPAPARAKKAAPAKRTRVQTVAPAAPAPAASPTATPAASPTATPAASPTATPAPAATE
jgi:hypothetical protein